MTYWIWSDTHFNHAGMLKHCAATRPVSSVGEMNEWLMTLWNEAVSPKDDIYLLGDWAFNHPDGIPTDELFKLLNGHKHLIVGNHDEKNKSVLKLPWVWVKDIHTLRVGIQDEKIRAVLCHYPMETWKNGHHGYLMLHGHCHGTLHTDGIVAHRFDVGVDAKHGPGPNPVEYYWELAKTQTYSPIDHHGM